MAPLTKKQTAQLSEMSHDVLVNIIYDLIQDNKQARTTLVNGICYRQQRYLKPSRRSMPDEPKANVFMITMMPMPFLTS